MSTDGWWRSRVLRVLLVAVVAVPLVTTPPDPSVADDDPGMDPPWWTEPIPSEHEFVPPSAPPEQPGAVPRLAAADPLGLVADLATTSFYTTRTDTIQVWRCNHTRSAAQLAGDLAADLTPYFRWLSNQRYDLRFVGGGNACSPGEVAPHLAAGNGAIFIDAGMGGGFAGPGISCSGWWVDCSVATWWDTGRYGVMGTDRMVIAHELGHMLSWPHVFSGKADDYDEPMDVMSGNFGPFGGGSYGTFNLPYATTAINRYAAGWFGPSQTVVHGSGSQTVDLRTPGSGTQMAIVRDSSGYFVLTPRVRTTLDPIPSAWQGVTVHKVLSTGSDHFAQRISQWPQTSYHWGTIRSSTFTQRLDHIIPVGGSRTIAGVTVRVTDAVSGGYRVTLQGTATGGGPASGCEATGTFTDVCDDNVFLTDIEWLAASGITRGCNPPDNDRFCPTRTVTRGQMAAFMVRALGLTDLDPSATFTDVPSDHVFRTDIQKLATAGITRGCNPPDNTRYCPNDPVTRQQMAAFFRRAPLP